MWLMAMSTESRALGEWATASAAVSDAPTLVLAGDGDLEPVGSFLSRVDDSHVRMLVTRFLQARWRTRIRRRPTPR
jgi:hypothetical protein